MTQEVEPDRAIIDKQLADILNEDPPEQDLSRLDPDVVALLTQTPDQQLRGGIERAKSTEYWKLRREAEIQGFVDATAIVPRLHHHAATRLLSYWFDRELRERTNPESLQALFGDDASLRLDQFFERFLDRLLSSPEFALSFYEHANDFLLLVRAHAMRVGCLLFVCTVLMAEEAVKKGLLAWDPAHHDTLMRVTT